MLGATRLRAPWAALAATLACVACGSDDSSTGALDGSVPSDGASTSDAGADATAFDAGGPEAAADAGGADTGVDTGAADAGHGQRLAVPMYVDPSSAALWQQVNAGAPTVGLVVANPDSGPGGAVDATYTTAIAQSRAAGLQVLGYVHTSYAARAAADVEADVASWYAFYPAIDGIFFDEVSTDAATVSSYYQALHDDVKGEPGAHVVALNPGTIVPEAFMAAGDILLTFEDTYAHYTDGTYPANPSWVASYPPSRFWHVVLSTPSGSLSDAIAQTRQRDVGWIYVTDRGPATAYQDIVTGAYWQSELAAASAP